MFGRLYENLTERATKFYHPGPGHLYNACDIHCSRWLRVVRAGAYALGSDCRCCSGFRVLLVALLGSIFPAFVSIAVALVFVVAILKEMIKPTGEYDYGDE